jgi:hypothetical protein
MGIDCFELYPVQSDVRNFNEPAQIEPGPPSSGALHL